MKAVIQRVVSASVTVDKQLVSSIGKGILVLAAVGPDDTKKDAEFLANKVLKLKIWPDENGLGWKKSVLEIQGEVLCVSQFTLYASTKKGNKPDFHGAAKPEQARELYDHFFEHTKSLYSPDKVKNGVFQAMMEVGLVNDGPVSDDLVGVDYVSIDSAVTIDIDTNPPKAPKDSSKDATTSKSQSSSTTGKSSPTKAAAKTKTDQDLESIIRGLPQELLD